MDKNELISDIIKDIPTMHYNKNGDDYIVYYGLSNKRTTHTIDEFRGKTFIETKEVFRILNHLYDSVLENNNEIYVIYEQNYDIINIIEAIYSKDIGSYITTIVLNSENPSWFISYDMNSNGIRILFKNPDTGEQKFTNINCYKVNLK